MKLDQGGSHYRRIYRAGWCYFLIIQWKKPHNKSQFVVKGSVNQAIDLVFVISWALWDKVSYNHLWVNFGVVKYLSRCLFFLRYVIFIFSSLQFHFWFLYSWVFLLIVDSFTVTAYVIILAILSLIEILAWYGKKS